MKFKVTAGQYTDAAGVNYKKDDKVESEQDLAGRFPEKFRRIGGDSGAEPEIEEVEKPTASAKAKAATAKAVKGQRTGSRWTS